MPEHATRVRPCRGESVSGDATIVVPLQRGLLAAIVDVLGHGPPAHELAVKIDAYLNRYAMPDVGALMKNLHAHLRGTRGAAVGLCAIDVAAGRASYVGVGNTVLRRIGAVETRLPSRYGVLGQNMPTPRPQTLALEPGDLVLLYTDGVSDRFCPNDYPGLRRESAEDVARKVVDRFGKDHDDAGVIAVRFGDTS